MQKLFNLMLISFISILISLVFGVMFSRTFIMLISWDICITYVFFYLFLWFQVLAIGLEFSLNLFLRTELRSDLLSFLWIGCPDFQYFLSSELAVQISNTTCWRNVLFSTLYSRLLRDYVDTCGFTSGLSFHSTDPSVLFLF